MTWHRSSLVVVTIALGTASCAPPPPEPPFKPTSEVQAAKPKPVEMNRRGEVTSISLTELFTLQESGRALIFDARPAFFYNLGHIPGAISMPKSGCDAQIAKRETEIKAALAAGKTIVVYCTNLLCPDARTVARHLASAGYSSATLPGGWDAWKESGLPTE